MIKLISAPIRSIVRFPLFQLAIAIGVILWLQAADDKSIFGQLFDGLDKLADSTVQLVSTVFTIKSFTKAWLISGFMIAFVYLTGLLILSLVRLTIKTAVDIAGRSNFSTSGLPLTTDILRVGRHVSNVPKADISLPVSDTMTTYVPTFERRLRLGE
jgi:hypothetical protein